MAESRFSEKLKFRDKLGYALGDTAGLLTFALISSFLQMFYTDALHIPLGKITVLMLAARIWDAVNDPMWGAFIDSRKPTKHGRFRPYILGASIPLAIAGVLLFTKIPGLSETQYLIYAYITYIFYGMMYTGTNIPYGSLASVVTGDPVERNSLSMWRSLGAGLGGLPAQMLLPMIVYTTGANGVKVLDSDKLFICVLILSVLSAAVYYIHFRLTKERLTATKKQAARQYDIKTTARALLKNKPFIVICLVSMLLIAFQMYTQTTYNYLFKNYYNKPGLYTFVTVCTYLPMAILIGFMNKLMTRFGKKEICAAGLGFAAVINILMYLFGFTPLKENPYIFLVMVFLSGAGQTFLVFEVWALVMDVIDYHEVLTHRKEEGTCYSVYNFVRKLGHSLAGAGSSLVLMVIGYDVNVTDVGQPQEVLDRLYGAATLVPAVMLTLMFILLAFCYGFSKKKLEELHRQIAAERAE